MYSETFGIRLKTARQTAGYTQEQVENMLPIKRAALSHYETGRREPSIETLAMLANFYNVTIDWLLGIGKQEPTKEK